MFIDISIHSGKKLFTVHLVSIDFQLFYFLTRIIHISLVKIAFDLKKIATEFFFPLSFRERNQQSRQTGSRNLMGPKTLPTIWGTL
jgi:hypothetical protein